MKSITPVLTLFFILSFISCQQQEINLNRFIKQHTGKSVKIALLDTGLADLVYSSYLDKITFTYDVTTETNEVQDLIGHGTSMVSIISNDYSTDIPISGIATEANLIILKVFDKLGRSSDLYLSKAIQIAIEQEADIINFSLGSSGEFPLIYDQITYASQLGILLCTSSGENPNIISFPASHPNVISIGQEDGPHFEEVDFLIPCANTKTYFILNNTIQLKDDSGSSIACAIFSGVCAGIISSRNKQSKKEVIVNLINEFSSKNFNQILLG